VVPRGTGAAACSSRRMTSLAATLDGRWVRLCLTARTAHHSSRITHHSSLTAHHAPHSDDVWCAAACGAAAHASLGERGPQVSRTRRSPSRRGAGASACGLSTRAVRTHPGPNRPPRHPPRHTSSPASPHTVQHAPYSPPPAWAGHVLLAPVGAAVRACASVVSLDEDADGSCLRGQVSLMATHIHPLQHTSTHRRQHMPSRPRCRS